MTTALTTATPVKAKAEEVTPVKADGDVTGLSPAAASLCAAYRPFKGLIQQTVNSPGSPALIETAEEERYHLQPGSQLGGMSPGSINTTLFQGKENKLNKRRHHKLDAGNYPAASDSDTDTDPEFGTDFGLGKPKKKKMKSLQHERKL